jgi:hypothetical protein
MQRKARGVQTVSAIGFMRVKKLKGANIVSVASAHNLRELHAGIGADNIDPQRSHQNTVLVGPTTAKGVAALAKARMEGEGIVKLRKDAVRAIELVFSLPGTHTADSERFFADCVAWSCRRFGADNLLSATRHADEAAPHLHVLMLPLANGRMVGSDLVGNKRTLMELQNAFHGEVAHLHGLKRATKMRGAWSKKEAVAAVMQHLRAAKDASLQSAIWPVLRDAIERDPWPSFAALGLVVPLTAKPSKTMTQIFISPGAGSKRETEPTLTTRKPIGFQTPESTRTLSCVGFPSKQELQRSGLPEVICASIEVSGKEETRVRDADLDPARFDPNTGEYAAATATPTGGERARAQRLVEKQLAALQHRRRGHRQEADAIDSK